MATELISDGDSTFHWKRTVRLRYSPNNLLEGAEVENSLILVRNLLEGENLLILVRNLLEGENSKNLLSFTVI